MILLKIKINENQEIFHFLDICVVMLVSYTFEVA